MNNKGITVVELLCVVGMLAIIVTTTLSLINTQKDKVFELTDKYAETYEILDEQIEDSSASEEEIRNKLNTSEYQQEINNALTETEQHYKEMQDAVKNIDVSELSSEDIEMIQRILEEKGATVTWN